MVVSIHFGAGIFILSIVLSMTILYSCSYFNMSDGTEPQSGIIIAKMAQQRDLRRPDDDWSGVISRSQRRKLQNRLNQRRHRTFCFVIAFDFASRETY